MIAESGVAVSINWMYGSTSLVGSQLELPFFTRVALFYDGLMDSIGANLNILWIFGMLIMAYIFIWAMKRE